MNRVVLIAVACLMGLSESGWASSKIITIDGSSTVFPITEAVAESFQQVANGTRVTIGISGTGGGFKKLCAGEIDIVNASRTMKAAEVAACALKKVAAIELPVAYDGIAVVVNSKNTWVDALTVAELKKIWEPSAQGKITTWNQIRSGWPKREIHLFGPGVDSGTFDYFTETVVGKGGASRGDFTASEDDNVLVQGVAMDLGSLGFFGMGYYEANADRLKAVPIRGAEGRPPVLPTYERVSDRTYAPLSRPLFVYVRKEAAGRPEIAQFVRFYLKHAAALVKEVGNVPLSDSLYVRALDRFERRVVGSLFSGQSSSADLEKLMK